MKVLRSYNATDTILADGDIAEIITSKYYPEDVGKIVMRYKDALILLGQHSDNSWEHFFPKNGEPLTYMKFKLLPKGTILEL